MFLLGTGLAGVAIPSPQATPVFKISDVDQDERYVEAIPETLQSWLISLDRRPTLSQALEAARSAKCPVVVAKLDRLSRDVAFISGLMAQRK